MNVVLSFDVEVWCNGWSRLDEVFPQHFERYVYGRSRHGEFALPATLEILRRHGLTGVFFVESLFSARFGAVYLEQIVAMIAGEGHQVQLHVHPEWVDEIAPPLIPANAVKRQYLSYYDLEEQTAIIAVGKRLLLDAGAPSITAFRAGSYAANGDSFEALRRNDILIDSSMNACFEISGTDLRGTQTISAPFTMAGVCSRPVAVFRDGFGRSRPAQVGACGFEELRDAMEAARLAGVADFVIVSHNFELLKPGSSEPDWIVVRRFEQLCEYLAASRDVLTVGGYETSLPRPAATPSTELPEVGVLPTVKRHIEQLRRRLG